MGHLMRVVDPSQDKRITRDEWEKFVKEGKARFSESAGSTVESKSGPELLDMLVADKTSVGDKKNVANILKDRLVAMETKFHALTQQLAVTSAQAKTSRSAADIAELG